MADWSGDRENIGHLFCRELKGNKKKSLNDVLLGSFPYFLPGFLFACLNQVFVRVSNCMVM